MGDTETGEMVTQEPPNEKEDVDPSMREESLMEEDHLVTFIEDCLTFPWFRRQISPRVRRTSERMIASWQRRRFFMGFNQLINNKLRSIQHRRQRSLEQVGNSADDNANEMLQYSCLLLL